ncbi:hypothetical protein [Caenimonas sp. SL110]|uniref:hypothetical protein n=1 Tax=Caenimonas sp. SL110 TaxID=1450524 RepID=UPI00065482EB|nr:hypothetical protein [Caenimonas sp. SL110]
MNPNDPNPKATGSNAPCAPVEPRSGSGADTAFEAMLRKRQVHPAEIDDIPLRDGLPGGAAVD